MHVDSKSLNFPPFFHLQLEIDPDHFNQMGDQTMIIQIQIVCDKMRSPKGNNCELKLVFIYMLYVSADTLVNVTTVINHLGNGSARREIV